MKHHTILNCIKVNITCYLILLMTYTGDIKAQILRDFLPIERVLLETILRDTISETFCQLPHGLTFGIDNKST
jgi:hypothetical protein